MEPSIPIRRPLGEILADEFRLLSPGDDVDEIGLTLPVPARKSTVTSYRKGADRYPIGSLLQFRVRGEAADQNSLVIHSDTALLSNNHGTQYAVGDLVDTVELGGELRGRSKFYQHVVTLGLILNGVSELSLAPLINIGDGARSH